MKVEELNFLKSVDEQEIYNNDKIKLSFCKNNYYNYFKITYINDINLVDDKEYNNLICEFSIKVLESLHISKIPYNLIFISNNIFIFPRNHENLISSAKFAFFEILGVYTFFDEEEFNNFKLESYDEGLKELWLDNATYKNLINLYKYKFC